MPRLRCELLPRRRARRRRARLKLVLMPLWMLVQPPQRKLVLLPLRSLEVPPRQRAHRLESLAPATATTTTSCRQC